MITKKYYKLVKVSYADSDYFRITNVDMTAGTLTINGSNNLGCNIEYSTDGVNWTTADPNAPFSLTVASGANVYMRGTNSNLNGKTINMNANHTVGGNVYSLLDKATYASRTTSVGTSEFQNLFKNNTHLISAADMNFGNVVSVGQSAYWGMFSGCTSLTSAPELPATSLNQHCYREMFNNCTSLTSAPELPATTLASNCYYIIFNGCRALQSIKCLATDISANNCTMSWVYDVSATGTFYKSANMSDWTTGVNGIPSGWTVIDA